MVGRASVGVVLMCLVAVVWGCGEPAAPARARSSASEPVAAPTSGPSQRCGGDPGCMAALADDVVREGCRSGRTALAGTAEELGVMLRAGRCAEARKVAEQRLEPWVYPDDEALTKATKTLALELVGAECR